MKQIYFFLLVLVFSVSLQSQNFRIKIKTTTANENFTIPTIGGGYNYDVKWRDNYKSGGLDVIVSFIDGYTGNATRTYPTPGEYTISIRGDFPRIRFNNTGDKDKVISIEQWGNIQWTSMDEAFYGCRNLEYNATDAPDLSQVTDLGRMFNNCTKFNAVDLNNWNVSNVEEMTFMFAEATLFNGAIDQWNVSNVVNFINMFSGTSLFNHDISSWNINNNSAVNMSGMFAGARKFNKNIGVWNTSQVTLMKDMFLEAREFNQSLGNWDISNVTNFTQMLNDSKLSLANYENTLQGWSTLTSGEVAIPTNITLGVARLFYGISTYRDILKNTYSWTFEGDAYGVIEEEKFITTWQTTENDESITIPTSGSGYNYTVQWGDGSLNENVTGNTSHTYSTPGVKTIKIYGDFPRIYFDDEGDKRKILSIEQWGTQVWESMGNAFEGCSNLTLNADDVPNLTSVRSMVRMFRRTAKLEDLKDKIGSWNTSEVTNMERLFEISVFNENINSWNVGKVENMNSIFSATTKFNKPLHNWDVRNVRTMHHAFSNSKVFNQNISNWKLENIGGVTSFSSLFFSAKAFNQNLGALDLSYVPDDSFFDYFFNESGMSTENYEATLKGWATLDTQNGETSIPTGVSIRTDNITFCKEAASRTFLKLNYSWNIIDGGLSCTEADKFITTWQTTFSNESIDIRTSGGFFDYTIEWGDGTTEVKNGTATHTYATPGVHTIKISGSFPKIYINGFSIGNKLLSVEQWGSIQWGDMVKAFKGAKNMVINATDTPNLSNCGDFYEAFYGCSNLTDNGGAMANWDFSTITRAPRMFQNTGLSSQEYDNLLIALANNPNLPNNIEFGAQGVNYCIAATQKANLQSKGWSIRDAGLNCSDAFITTWKTTTANQSITIPTTGVGYNYTVDWGDGTVESGVTGNANHNYTTAAYYTVTILGDFPRIYFNNTGDKDIIVSIDQWGTQQWSSMEGAFFGCTALELNVTDTPDLSLATSTERMFMGTTNFVDNEASIGSWDTSTITNMANMFTDSIFNFDITTWNVGKVENFFGMFSGNTVFNQNISGWNIGENVTGTINMNSMFQNTQRFNQSIGSWDISNVTDMSLMFDGSVLSTDNYDSTLLGWATLNAGETKIPIGIIFDAGNSTYCFEGRSKNALTNAPYNWTITDEGSSCEDDFFVTTWQTTVANQSITIPTTEVGYDYTVDWGDGTIESGFTGNAMHSYTTANIYTVKILGDFPRIYFNNTGDKDKIITIEQWGTYQWTSTAGAFYGCENLKVTATDRPELSQVTDMSNMFKDCVGLEDVGGKMGAWSVSSVENFNSMFLNASLFNRGLGAWDISSATNIADMLSHTGFTSTTYDVTLIRWRENPNTPSGLNLGADGLTYCNAVSQHEYLDNDLNWTLNDAGINCSTNEPFITTWQTTTSNETITIPTKGAGNYFVDWGDGTPVTYETSNASHEYATAGVYEVKITGYFPRIYFNNRSGSRGKIKSIEQWGANEWSTMYAAFTGCSNLTYNATDTPNLATVTSCFAMFSSCTQIGSPDLNLWDVSNITSMYFMFANSNFNGTINDWDVSNVKNMERMFYKVTNFNQSLANWDISSATNMSDMLYETGLSTENYDATLIGWATLEANEAQIPVGITTRAKGLTYCLGINAKNTLTNAPYNWSIGDAGLNCSEIAFTTTWQTTVGNESITIPTTGSGYNYTVDWGDGTMEDGFTGNATHNYTTAGTYTVKIWNNFPRIYFNATGDKDKILTIEQWGTNQWTNMSSAFRGCSNLVLNADDTPDFSGVTNMNIDKMFSSAVNLIDHKNQIGNWNVSNVNRMFGTFNNCKEFNEDISSWNVSNVTTFLQAFLDAEKFNQNLSGWVTSSATTMATMFARAYAFNQDISGWDTSKVNSMGSMFTDATAFNQDISGWNVSSVENMQSMFARATAFNQDLSSWDISSLGTGTSANLNKSALNMLLDATKFSNENYEKLLKGWSTLESGETRIPTDVVLHTSASYCAGERAKSRLIAAPYNWVITDEGINCDFTDAFITTWQTTTANESITIPTNGEGYNYAIDWGDGTVYGGLTGNATHSYATAGTYSVKISGDFPGVYFNDTGDKDKIQSIEQWGVIEWNSMAKSFTGCSNLVLNATDIPDLSKVTNANRMFESTSSFVDNGGRIGDWNMSTIKTLGYVFRNSAFNENINNWNVSNVTFMGYIFFNTQNFNQPLNNWKLSSNVSLFRAFDGATAFNQNLGDWDISGVNNMDNMLSNSGMSDENYDNTIIGWATLDTGEAQVPSDIVLGATGLSYCYGETARNTLSSTYNWIITDSGKSCDFSDAFITTWETTSANESIIIPTRGSGYNYLVDWGDGTIEAGFTGRATHEYAAAGTYEVKINGDFPRIYMRANFPNRKKILTVKQWGTQQWTSMEYSFYNCTQLIIDATDVPDLSKAISLRSMFDGTTSLVDNGGSIGNWNVSTIENMGSLFNSSNFNGNIGAWNVAKVKTFSSMFFRNVRFNQNLNSWITISGEYFSSMFNGATAFNGNITNWKTSASLSFANMFRGATAFNQDISGWDTKNVGNINNTFERATAFDQNLGTWDISSVIENTNSLQHMFSNSGMSTTNYESTLIGWTRLDAGETKIPVGVIFDAEGITYCLGATARNTLTSTYNWTINDGGISCDFTDAFITTWETTADNESITIPTRESGYSYIIDWGDGTIEGGLTGNTSHSYTTAGTYTVKISGDFPRIFFSSNAASKEKIQSVEQWGAIQWTSMNGAFSGCTNLKLNAIDAPDLTRVTSMYRMFRQTTSLVDTQNMIGNWNVSNITSMGELFEDSGFNENINNWDVRNVQSMTYMFHDNTVFNQPLDQWEPESTSDFEHMFNGATAFNQPLGNWNVSNTTYFESMFQNATAFNQNLGNWDISNVDRLGMVNTFIGSGMSQTNYDTTLMGWATIDSGETRIPVNLKLDASATYCLGEAARNTLTTTYNWTITDGSKDCTNTIVWTGTVNSDWNTAGNWNTNLVPESTKNVFIANVVITPEITSNVEVNSLTIEASASFDILENGSVTVNENFTNTGTFNMIATKDNSGVLIVKGTSNGQVTYERGGLEANKWSIVTAPVIGQSIKEFAENPANNIRKNTTVTPNRYAIGYYDDSKASGTKWTYYTTTDLTTNTLTFEKGKSYTVSRGTNGSVTFTGTLETANVAKSVTASQWNAVGNPYTTFLPINKNGGANFVNDNLNKLDPAYVAAYLWNTAQNKYVPHSLVNSESSLAPGQGFFVKATTGVSKVVFNQTHRMSQRSLGGVFSKGFVHKIPSIELSVSNSKRIVTTALTYFDNATEGLDPGYDLGNYGSASFDVFTRLVKDKNGIDYTMQSLPNTTGSNTIVPVGIKTNGEEEIRFSVKGLNLQAGMEVFIEDKELNTLTKLDVENGIDYAIKVSGKSVGIGRFYVHMKSTKLPVDILDINDLKVYNIDNETLIVDGILKGKFNCKLYTILGALIVETIEEGKGKNSVTLPELPTGVYIVRVNSDLGVKSQKIMIK